MHSASDKTPSVGPAGNDIKQMESASRAKKDFETGHSGVFATPGLPLAHLTAKSALN
jgi:hypothetical protein